MKWSDYDMKDLPILWLIFNTKIGRAIVCFILAGAFIQVAGWWVVPIMSAIIAALLLGDYTNDEYQDKKTKKIKLIIALCLLAIAAVWTLVKFYLEFGITK